MKTLFIHGLETTSHHPILLADFTFISCAFPSQVGKLGEQGLFQNKGGGLIYNAV